MNKSKNSDLYDATGINADTRSRKDWIPARWVLAFWSSFGFLIVYILRVNMSVTLIAMVNNTAVREAENVSEDCPLRYNNTEEIKEDGPFLWSRLTQGVILSAFFYGYVSTQIIGGWLADRFSAKYVFGLGVLVTSIFTLFTPAAANLGSNWLIVARVLTGIGEGVTYPAMGSLWAKWAPKDERGVLISLSYSGSLFGVIIGMPLSGALSHSKVFNGWPSVFYVCGIMGCVWFVFWLFCVYESPNSHPRISLQEKHYIEKSIGKIPPPMPLTEVPWFSVLISLPVLAIGFASFASSWGFYVLLTSLPQYLKVILRFSITENGFLSMLPHISGYIFTVLSGMTADYISKRKLMRVSLNRKVHAFIALVPSAVITAMVPYAGCDATWVMFLLCAAMATNGFTGGSLTINYLDIAPRLGGTVFGFINTLANFAGVLSPYVVGVITSKQSTMKEWSLVFYLSAIIYCCGALIYLIFASTKVQLWAEESKHSEEHSSLLGSEAIYENPVEKAIVRPLIHKKSK